uniref:Uncharacterized protein n=1 Tax=Oryza barthii TaxID=65489 RepID=A0A0D3GCM7_9ORYZ
MGALHVLPPPLRPSLAVIANGHATIYEDAGRRRTLHLHHAATPSPHLAPSLLWIDGAKQPIGTVMAAAMVEGAGGG